MKYLREWRAVLILLSIAGVVTFGYVHRVHVPNLDQRYELHNEIMDQEAPSPYRYRVLVPIIGEGIVQVFQLALSREKAVRLTYILVDFTLISLLLVILYIHFRGWFSPLQSLLGAAFVGGTMPVALTNHWFAPWSILEAIFFTLALMLIGANRYRLLILLVFIATFNRATALFIPVLYFFCMADFEAIKKYRRLPWRVVVRAALLLMVWAVTYVGLRYVQGDAIHVTTIGKNLLDNIQPHYLVRTVLYLSLFLGAFWIFAIGGLRRAPELLRKAALVIPFYLLVMMPFAVWYEVRVFMTLYAIIIPIGLSYLFPRHSPEIEDLGAA